MKKLIPNLFLLSVFCYLLFLITPALLGQLGGLYKHTTVPDEYVRLEKFISSQPGYFRTLWFPAKQRFGYYSQIHPEISSTALFNIYDEKSLFKKLSSPDTEQMLKEASIKYIIVPFDSEKEIFMTDRKYDNRKYLSTIQQLEKIKWLKPASAAFDAVEWIPLNRIVVFQINNPKDHFWSLSPGIKLSYKYVNNTKYLINIENGQKGDRIIFSEQYDKGWKFTSSADLNNILPNIKYKNYNSFVIPENGNYNLDVYYDYQKWVDIGTIISLTSLIIIISLIVLTLIYEKAK